MNLYRFQIGKTVELKPISTFKGFYGLQFKALIAGKVWCLPHHQQLNNKLLLKPRHKAVTVTLIKKGYKHQETEYYIK